MLKYEVAMTGWRVGFEKVAFTRLLNIVFLMEEKSADLRRAKALTDALLNGDRICIHVGSSVRANGFMRTALTLGVETGEVRESGDDSDGSK